MNKSTKIGVGIIVIILVIWGILFSTHTSSKNGTSFTIGVSLPLTGPVSFAGVSYRDGLLAAQKKINSENGVNDKPLAFVFEDNANDAKIGLSSFEKLRQDKPDFYLITGSVPASAISPVADQDDVPIFVSMSFSNTQEKYQNQVSFYPTAQADAQSTVDTMVKNGVTKVAVLYLNTDYGQAVLSAFKPLALAKGISVVYEDSFLATDNDFKSQISKTFTSKPQAVFVVAINSLPVIKQLKAFNPSVAIYTNNPAVSGSLIYKDPATFDGVYLTGYKSTIPGTLEFAKIRDEVGTSSPNNTMGYTAAAYDNMLAIAAVLTKNPDVSQFVKTFSSYGTFSGINGTYDLSGRNISIPLYPVQFKDGTLREIQ